MLLGYKIEENTVCWNGEGPELSLKATFKILLCTAGVEGVFKGTGKKIDLAENPYVSSVNPGQEKTGAGTQPGSSELLNTSPCCNLRTFLSGPVPFSLTVSVAGRGCVFLWWKKVISWSHPLVLTRGKSAT